MSVKVIRRAGGGSHVNDLLELPYSGSVAVARFLMYDAGNGVVKPATAGIHLAEVAGVCVGVQTAASMLAKTDRVEVLPLLPGDIIEADYSTGTPKIGTPIQITDAASVKEATTGWQIGVVISLTQTGDTSYTVKAIIQPGEEGQSG